MSSRSNRNSKSGDNKLIKFDIPPDSLMYGTGLIKGDIAAFVVRCYEGEWTVFYYRDCHLLMNTSTSQYISKHEALSNAMSYMRTGVVPTVVAEKEVRKVDHADNLMVRCYKNFGVARMQQELPND
jgi:hypothetical protein